ncbi:hypothetical protein TruAng_012289 [Truncatella angustata]|nr:hypothetical protein TruAng_012289 [Truncatella angustata]
MKNVPISRLETIDAYVIEPWIDRVEVVSGGSDRATELAGAQWAVRIATASSSKNDLVGFGVATRLPESSSAKNKFMLQSVTLRTREEQNPYTAELATMTRGLRKVPQYLRQRVVMIFTSNNGAALSMKQPRHQSGQKEITDFYASVAQLRKKRNKIIIVQRAQEHAENQDDDEVINDNTRRHANNGIFALVRLAKEATRKATLPGGPPRAAPFRAKSTTLNNARKTLNKPEALPDNIRAFSKRIDTALPGRHTRLLYDALSWKEASVLVQLRTGMARLNYYLAQISAVASPQCDYGHAKETVKHFVLHYRKWTSHRKDLLKYTQNRSRSISFLVSGKTNSDDKD